MGKFVKLFNNNVKIFFTKQNWYQTFLLIGIPFIFLVVLFVIDSYLKGNVHLQLSIEWWHRNKVSIFCIFLSIYGIFITARVLMAVTLDKTFTMEDYLSNLLNIIKKSKNGDELYWIAPTFCAGISVYDSLLNNIYEKLQNNKGIKMKCAFLHVPDSDEEQGKEEFDHHWKMYSAIISSEFEGLANTSRTPSKIHILSKGRKFELSRESYEIARKGQVYSEEGAYWKRINAIKGIEIYGLDYYKYFPLNRAPLFDGFFAIANLTQGKYYLGSFFHREKTTFEGTLFENKHIKEPMGTFFKNFIEIFKK